MGETLDGPLCIMENSQGCIQFVQSNRINRRSKQIETKERYVREMVNKGAARLEYCSNEQA